MSSVPQFTVTSRNERHEARDYKRGFEDHAASILEKHVSRLDVHRRSVLLFYLLFGLLAGFFLGIAGAKGVLAKAVDAELIAPEPGYHLILSDAAMPSELPIDLDVAETFGPRHDFRTPASDRDTDPGHRYAALLFGDAHPTIAHSTQGLHAVALQADTELANKDLLMGLLALIMLITGSLTFTFWRHLSKSYAPRRKTQFEWAPRKHSQD